jgi:hypothetical protein
LERGGSPLRNREKIEILFLLDLATVVAVDVSGVPWDGNGTESSIDDS